MLGLEKTALTEVNMDKAKIIYHRRQRSTHDLLPVYSPMFTYTSNRPLLIPLRGHPEYQNLQT